jgi:hypothetical protein
MSMDKDRQGELLSAYLDGELDAAESARAAELIETDPAAAEQAERLDRVRGLLSELPRESAGTSLADQVISRARKGTYVGGGSAAAPRRRGRAALAAAAAVLVAIGAGWLVIGRPMQQPSQEGEAVEARAPQGDPGPAMVAMRAGYFQDADGVFEIYSDNLLEGQGQVEDILDRHTVEPVVGSGGDASAASGGWAANYVVDRPGSDRLQYVVEAKPEQIARIVRDLNTLRARRNAPRLATSRGRVYAEPRYVMREGARETGTYERPDSDAATLPKPTCGPACGGTSRAGGESDEAATGLRPAGAGEAAPSVPTAPATAPAEAVGSRPSVEEIAPAKPAEADEDAERVGRSGRRDRKMGEKARTRRAVRMQRLTIIVNVNIEDPASREASPADE